MNDRQRYALDHPLNDARNDLRRDDCTYQRIRGDGSLLVMVLAIDR